MAGRKWIVTHNLSFIIRLVVLTDLGHRYNALWIIDGGVRLEKDRWVWWRLSTRDLPDLVNVSMIR